MIRKCTREMGIEQGQFGKVRIQTIICKNGKKVLAVKLPQEILRATQQNYGNVVKAVGQHFSDYFVIFIRNFEADGGTGNGFEDRERNWLANACFPFLLTGTRTDVRSVSEHTVNVLLEKRTSFSKAEMEMIGAALSSLLGRSYVVGINHHTRN